MYMCNHDNTVTCTRVTIATHLNSLVVRMGALPLARHWRARLRTISCNFT